MVANPTRGYAPAGTGKGDMGQVASRLLQTLRLERQAYVWMDFNDRATGDALMLVAISQVLLFAGFAGGLGSLFNVGLWELLISFLMSVLMKSWIPVKT